MANRISAYTRQRQKLVLEASDFSGGFFPQLTDYDMNTRFVRDIQNMELVNGFWQKRKGFHLAGEFDGVRSTPNMAKGLFVFNQLDTVHILGVFDDDLYVKRQFSGSNYGRKIYSKVHETRRVRFTEYRSNCYIAHGKENLLKYDGNDVYEISAPAGSIIASYDNRLVVSGIKGDPMVLYYSEYGDGDTWPALNFIVLDGGFHEFITALIPVHGRLVIFTNRAIYSLVGTLDDFSVTKEVDGIGAVNAEAIQIFGSRFYFVSEDGNIYEYDGGSMPRNISQQIKPYLEANITGYATQNVVTTTYKDAVWFTFDTSFKPEERITLVYYPQSAAWTKFLGIPAAFYIHNRETLYFTGSHNKFSLYQYDTQHSDDGVAIDGYLRTPNWSFDALENIKRFKTIYIRGALQGGGKSGFDVHFYIDDQKVATVRASSQDITIAPKWGSAIWGDFSWDTDELNDDVGYVYTKIYLSQYNVISGKTFSIVFQEKSTDHSFRIESIRLEYIQKGAR